MDTYREEVEGLAKWVCGAKPLPGFNQVYAPGEIEVENRSRMLLEGIDLPEPTWVAIGQVARELGIEMPAV